MASLATWACWWLLLLNRAFALGIHVRREELPDVLPPRSIQAGHDGARHGEAGQHEALPADSLPDELADPGTVKIPGYEDHLPPEIRLMHNSGLLPDEFQPPDFQPPFSVANFERGGAELPQRPTEPPQPLPKEMDPHLLGQMPNLSENDDWWLPGGSTDGPAPASAPGSAMIEWPLEADSGVPSPPPMLFPVSDDMLDDHGLPKTTAFPWAAMQQDTPTPDPGKVDQVWPPPPQGIYHTGGDPDVQPPPFSPPVFPLPKPGIPKVPPHGDQKMPSGGGDECRSTLLETQDYLSIYTISSIRMMASNYGDHAWTQRKHVELLVPEVMKEIQDGGVIYDYGCADGVNAMVLAKAVMTRTVNFTMGLVDLPTNDWVMARERVAGIMGRVEPESCAFTAPVSEKEKVASFPRVTDLGPTALLVRGNFYRNVIAPASVNIAVSTTAVHFLNHGYGTSVEAQAANDWLQFLLNREKELVPGGLLLVTAPARRLHEEPTASFTGVNTVMNWTLIQAYRQRLITRHQYQAWLFPTHSRRADEWMKPFATKAVKDLYVESLSMVAFDTPYQKASYRDRERFAELYIPSIMSWLGPYLMRVLGAKTHNLFKYNLKRTIIYQPDNFVKDSLQALVKIRKAG